MGGGLYSTECRALRSESMGYATKKKEAIFTGTTINNAMIPTGIKSHYA